MDVKKKRVNIYKNKQGTNKEKNALIPSTALQITCFADSTSVQYIHPGWFSCIYLSFFLS